MNSHTSELRLKYERSLAGIGSRVLKLRLNVTIPSLRDKYQAHKANLNRHNTRRSPVSRELYNNNERIDDEIERYSKSVGRNQDAYRRPLSPLTRRSGYTRPLRSPISKTTTKSKIPRSSNFQINVPSDEIIEPKTSSLFSKLRGYLGGFNPFNAGDSELNTLEDSAKALYPPERRPQKKVTFQEQIKPNYFTDVDVDVVDEIVQQNRNKQLGPHIEFAHGVEINPSADIEAQNLRKQISILSQDVNVLKEEKNLALTSLRDLEMKERSLKSEIELTKDQYESKLSKLKRILDDGNSDIATLKLQLEQKESAISLRDLQLQDLQKRLEKDDIELNLSQRLFDQKCIYSRRVKKLLLLQSRIEREIQHLNMQYVHFTEGLSSVPSLDAKSSLKVYESIKDSLSKSNFTENGADASMMKDLVERMTSYTESEIKKKSRRLKRLKDAIKNVLEVRSMSYLRKLRQIHAIQSKTLMLVQIQILLCKIDYLAQIRLDIRDSGLPYTLQEKWTAFCFANDFSSTSESEEEILG